MSQWSPQNSIGPSLLLYTSLQYMTDSLNLYVLGTVLENIAISRILSSLKCRSVYAAYIIIFPLLFCIFSPPTTRRRTRDHRDGHQMSGSSRHSESPERRAFQPPHIPTRQIHPAAMLPQPHPIVLDVEQVCTEPLCLHTCSEWFRFLGGNFTTDFIYGIKRT